MSTTRFVLLSLTLIPISVGDLSAQNAAQKLQIQSVTNVGALNPSSLTAEANAIQERAIADQWAVMNGTPISFTLPDGTFFELKSMTDGPVYYTTFNSIAAKTISTDAVQIIQGLDGTGITIAM